MKLTDKTTKRFFWREPGNRFFIEIDGQPVELKYTVSQNERYQAHLSNKKDLAKEEKPTEKESREMTKEEYTSKVVANSLQHASRILEIALNPKIEPEQKYSHEQILEMFEERLDLMQIVARTWLEKKVFNPVLDNVLDPHLAP